VTAPWEGHLCSQNLSCDLGVVTVAAMPFSLNEQKTQKGLVEMENLFLFLVLIRGIEPS
jgi:hypothetical protein